MKKRKYFIYKKLEYITSKYKKNKPRYKKKN